MDPSPTAVVIWQARHKAHVLRCVVELLGEDCLELRLYSDAALLVADSFDAVGPLLTRATELRAEFAASPS